MAPSLKAILLIAAVTPTNAVHFSFYSSSDCTGSATASAATGLFKAFFAPSSTNLCFTGYFEPRSGNFYMKGVCSSTELTLTAYNTTGCSGTNTVVKTAYIASAQVTNFMTANGTTDNNNENYGMCVPFSDASGGAAAGSVQFSKASTSDITGISEAMPCASSGTTSGNGTTSGGGTTSTGNATSSNGSSLNTTAGPAKASSSDSSRAGYFLASGMAVAWMLN